MNHIMVEDNIINTLPGDNVKGIFAYINRLRLSGWLLLSGLCDYCKSILFIPVNLVQSF